MSDGHMPAASKRRVCLATTLVPVPVRCLEFVTAKAEAEQRKQAPLSLLLGSLIVSFFLNFLNSAERDPRAVSQVFPAGPEVIK